MSSKKLTNEGLPSAHKIQCPCGSRINPKSETQHKLTKKHIRYEKTGLTSLSDRKEYQRDRFKNNPELRKKQREACRSWYVNNKEKLLNRRKQFPCRAKIKSKLEVSLISIFKRHLIRMNV